MLDVTIRSAYSQTTAEIPNTKQNLRNADLAKLAKYKNYTSEFHARIQPLSFTTFGAQSTSVKDFIKDLEQCAIINGMYFPKIDRKFSIIWQENISFSIARTTYEYASLAAQSHNTNYAHFLAAQHQTD